MSLLKFSDISKLFEEIELKLIASLKRNLNLHREQEKQAGYNWTAWQAEKLRSMNKFRRENINILNDYSPIIEEETDTLMREQFKEGEDLVTSQLEELKLINAESTADDLVTNDNFFGINENKMNALMSDITQLEKNVSSAALRMTDDVYRQTLNRVQLAMGTGSMPLQKAIDEATKDFLDKGINCIEYKNGRRVNIADYVRMALRTTSARASLQGQAKQFAELGYDTVLVSQYDACSETCLPWQGRVYIDDVFTSWNGETYGDKGKSNYCGKWFTLLSAAVREGLFHPNCRHSLSIYIDGITTVPKPLNAETVRKNANLESRQRRLENKVRRAKRFVNGCTDPENIKNAKADLRKAQKELRDFVNEHSAVLKRDYGREKVYDEQAKGSKNYSKATDLFNDYGAPENAKITAEQVYDDLKTSKTGLEVLNTVENLPQRIKFDYDTYKPDLYGEQNGNEVVIYMRSCNDVKRVSCTVIHECTHYKYGIGDSQWAESVCIAQEIKHRRGREYLTISEKRNIIKAVKEAYSDKNWRRGGIINGRRKSH